MADMADGINPKEIGVIGLNEHRLRMAEAVQAERERCAKIAEDSEGLGWTHEWPICAQFIKKKIREGAE